MHDFFCLRPSGSCPPLAKMVAEVMRFFDDFAKPLSKDELERRRQAVLSPRQELLLQKRFHPGICQDVRLGSFCLFMEEDGAPMRLIEVFPLG